MSLHPCPECGKQVSDKAPACVHCGAPLATSGDPLIGLRLESGRPRATSQSSSRSARVTANQAFAVIGLFLLGLTIYAWLYDPKYEPVRVRVRVPDLKASVTFTGTQIIVANHDDFAWTNCELNLNGAGSSGFKLRADHMDANGLLTVGVMRFAKDNGERFNPIAYKATSIFINCHTPSGSETYYGGWN